MQGLRDIKPLYDINDYLLLAGEVLLLLLVIIIAVWLIKKAYSAKKRVNERPHYINALQNIDYSNAKSAAYQITKNMQCLAISEREIGLMNTLIEELEVYKYQKEVPDLKDEIKGKVEIFIGVASES
jgi:hypothetical protein